MEEPSLLRVAIAMAPLAALAGVILLFPRSRLARRLLAPVGPRFDLRTMTRRDCLRAAAGFSLLGATGIGLFTLLAMASTRVLGAYDRNLPLAVIAGTYLVLGFLFLVAAAVLLLLAPFRPGTLEEAAPGPLPPFLKEYRSADRRTAIRLYAMPEGQVLVLQAGFGGPATADPDDPAHRGEWSRLALVRQAATLEEAEAVALRGVLPAPPAGDST